MLKNIMLCLCFILIGESSASGKGQQVEKKILGESFENTGTKTIKLLPGQSKEQSTLTIDGYRLTIKVTNEFWNNIGNKEKKVEIVAIYKKGELNPNDFTLTAKKTKDGILLYLDDEA